MYYPINCINFAKNKEKSMKKIYLLFVFIFAVAFNSRALYQQEIDGVLYSCDEFEGMCTVSAAENCSGDIVIKRTMKFVDATEGEFVSMVKVIGAKGFAGNNNITSIKVEEYEGAKTPLFYVYDSAFANCSALKAISLPSDLCCFYGNCFDGCNNLSALILPVDSPNKITYLFEPTPAFIDVPTVYPKLYLYVNNVDAFQTAANVQGSFWSSFNGRIKDISEYNPSTEPDEPDPVEPTSTTLTIRVNSGSIVIPEATAGQKLVFVPDDGAALSTPEFETEIVDGNHTYTVPEKAGSVEIHPQFYDPMSSSISVERVQPKVTVCGNRVEVSSIADGDDIVICNVNGIEIYRGSQHVHELLPGVYVISVGSYNFKLAI